MVLFIAHSEPSFFSIQIELKIHIFAISEGVSGCEQILHIIVSIRKNKTPL